jgi:hypothetical protein
LVVVLVWLRLVLSRFLVAVEDLNSKARKIKMARYSTEAERQNAEFTALPFDVHSGFGSHSASVFARFGKIANASPDEFIRAAVLNSGAGDWV